MPNPVQTNQPNQEWPPERVKALRMRLGLTFAEFAERLGVKLASAQKWCVPVNASNYRKPSGPVVALLNRLEEDARQLNPLNIDLLSARQREGHSRGGLKGTQSRYGK